jgi:hypothetical protein
MSADAERFDAKATVLIENVTHQHWPGCAPSDPWSVALAWITVTYKATMAVAESREQARAAWDQRGPPRGISEPVPRQAPSPASPPRSRT